MLKITLISIALASSLFADATIKTKSNVIYTIDGKESIATSAKEGSVIEYKSGNGKLSIKDSVTNKSIALRKVGDKYEVAKEGSSLGSLKTYFAEAEIENKGAFTRGDGSCAPINLAKDALPITADVAIIRYYQEDKLVAEYKVENKALKLLSAKAPQSHAGDTIRLLDKDEYDIGCLVVE